MSFVPTPWRWVHLVLDSGIVGTGLFFSWAAWRRFTSRPPLGRIAAGLAAGLLPWAVAGLALGGILGMSLIARTAWTTATVTLPLMMVFAARRGAPRALWAAAALLVALKFAGEVWEPSRLEVTRVSIPVAGLRSPVRVAQLTDLQTDGISRKELAARDAVAAFDPDLVLFTGDVLNHPSLVEPVFDYLSGFKAKTAKLYVPGDVDGGLDLDRFQTVTGFESIAGKVRRVDAGGAKIAVLGFGLYDYLRGEGFVDRLVRSAQGADVRIAMSHRPDAAFALAGKGVPLLFAGHTHGGQLQLPFFGPVVTLTSVPRAVAGGGVHRFLGQTIVLPRGLGWEGHIAPRVRLFCRPQIILADLVPAPHP